MHGQYLKNMKNNRVFLFAAVLIMSFSTPINANSPSDLIDAIMRLDDFGIIKSDIIADLTIIQADSSYIRVIAPKNFVQRMEVSVKDNLLEVSTRKTYMKGKKIKLLFAALQFTEFSITVTAMLIFLAPYGQRVFILKTRELEMSTLII